VRLAYTGVRATAADAASDGGRSLHNAVVAATPRLIALRAVHGEVYAAAPAAAHAADGTANGGAVVCANAAATWPVTAHVATTPPVQKSARRVSASLSGSTTTAG
jgi:hypothetical protein